MAAERVGRSRKKYYGQVLPNDGVILLNADYSYLHVVSWEKAVTLITKGKVQVLKLGKRVVRNYERTKEIVVPLIMRLISMIRTLYRSKVPYSKRNVFIRDDFTCCYCHCKPGKLTIEHVVPKDQGGKSNWENTVAACQPCNNKKENRTPSQARMYLKRQPHAPTINEFLQVRMKRLGIGDILDEFFNTAL